MDLSPTRLIVFYYNDHCYALRLWNLVLAAVLLLGVVAFAAFAAWRFMEKS